MSQRLFRLVLTTIMVSLLTTGGAHAQFRTLPQNAKFARVGDAQPLPLIRLDDKVVKLAPGGVIYDQNNRTVVQAALPAGARVAYVLDMSGDVGRIYILTAQEQAQADRK